MQIVVKGIGKESLKPNLIGLNLRFKEDDVDYNKVLENGSKVVNRFINDVLVPSGLNSEDLKTTNLNVKENRVYNNTTGEYELKGYSYNQNSYIEFDYNNELLSDLINRLKYFSNSLSYSVNYSIKDEEEVKKSLYTKAFNDAKNQAEIIALANNQKLARCIKASFESFEDNITSNSSFDDMTSYSKTMNNNNFDIDFNKILTPENITIKQEIYCMWIAE